VAPAASPRHHLQLFGRRFPTDEIRITEFLEVWQKDALGMLGKQMVATKWGYQGRYKQHKLLECLLSNIMLSNIMLSIPVQQEII
jgi:hypothetical protein